MCKCVFSLKGDKHRGMFCVYHKVIGPIILKNILFQWEARWPRGLCAFPQIKRPGLSPGPGTALNCVFGQDTFTALLPIQVYKWVPANLMLGEHSDGLGSHPGRSRNIPCRLCLLKSDVSTSHVARDCAHLKKKCCYNYG